MLLSELTKKEVLDVNANKVGSTMDVELNMAQGTVEHFILKTGMIKKVPLTADKIGTIGEKEILTVSKESLENSPVGLK